MLLGAKPVADLIICACSFISLECVLPRHRKGPYVPALGFLVTLRMGFDVTLCVSIEVLELELERLCHRWPA